MQIVISHMSALDFWRKIYPVTRAPSGTASAVDFRELALTDEEVWSTAPTWVTPQFLEPEGGTLHILVFAQNQKRRRTTYRTHLWSAPLPPGSLYDFGSGAYVCSPEFVFLQMASQLETAQLVALACELCGLYSLDESAERGLRKRQVPLVSLNELVSYIECARRLKIRSASHALGALRLAVERCASPMETASAMLLTLPVRMGGYAIPQPAMNLEIPLTSAARRLCPTERCYGDMCWPGAHLDLEYLGDHDHSGKQAMEQDRGRTDALIAMGFTVIEATSAQVRDWRAFEEIAVTIAGRLSRRIRTESRGNLEARAELRRLVFDWNRASGRVR